MTIKAHQIPFNKIVGILAFVLLFLGICFFFFSCQKIVEKTTKLPFATHQKGITILADSLILKANEGLVYFQNKPFTGTAVAFFEKQNNKSQSIDYQQGKRHGFYRKWFEDGQLSFESRYVQNKRHGKTQTWWRNGNLRSIANYKQGVPNGLQEQFYVSGAKFKKINLADGKEVGLQQSWRENGKLYNNYEAKNGRIFGLKRANLCYELEDEIVKITN